MQTKNGLHIYVIYLKLSVPIFFQCVSDLIFSINKFGSKIIYVDTEWPYPPHGVGLLSPIPIQFTFRDKVGNYGIQRRVTTMTFVFYKGVSTTMTLVHPSARMTSPVSTSMGNKSMAAIGQGSPGETDILIG